MSQRVPCPLVLRTARPSCLVQLPGATQEPPQTNRQGTHAGARTAPGKLVVGPRDLVGDRPGQRRGKREAQMGYRRVLAGQQPHGPFADRGNRPPAPVDGLPDRRRLGPMIGEGLVEPHGEEFRRAGREEALCREVAKVPVLGQLDGVAETEGQSHRRQRMVMPGRIANEDSAWGPVGEAWPQRIGRGVESSRSQRLDERGPERLGQPAGIRTRQEIDPVLGRVVQRDIDDHPDAMLSHPVDEHGARSAAHHMPIALQRQRHVIQHDPHHAGAGGRARRQTQRSAYGGRSTVGADDPRGAHGSVGVVPRKDDLLVFDCAYARLEQEVDARLVLDCFTHP